MAALRQAIGQCSFAHRGLHVHTCMSTTYMASQRSWDDVLVKLSDLITFKTRADGKGWRDAYDNMPIYLEGSTCAMMESILRHSGYRTGLYTSPHLCDVRERIRINGQKVPQEVFAEHFWACHDALQAAATEKVGVPGYFRFMTLLGLRIFLSQQVDVAVLEVGIGGRLDATNVIPRPVVCGITSLGFDHMELLGNTLGAIAREKGGILKRGAPAYSVEQPVEAMDSLQACAQAAGTTISVPPPLGAFTTSTGHPPGIGLGGSHQAVNAALAVQLAAAWEARAGAAAGNEGAAARVAGLQALQLPVEYERGLLETSWPGRSQVVHDPGFATGPSSSRLTLFLDGAHTPESMESCGAWFAGQVQQAQQAQHPEQAGLSSAVNEHQLPASGALRNAKDRTCSSSNATGDRASSSGADGHTSQRSEQQPTQRRTVLVFNCMKERDPSALLEHLQSALAAHNVHVHHALFVPPDSHYGFLASSATQQQAQALKQDVLWQQELCGIWKRGLQQHKAAGEQGGASDELQLPHLPPLPGGPQEQECRAAAGISGVMPSVASTLEWLRRCAREQPQLQLQVLVTGSLYLVGDMLRALDRAPE